MKLFQRILSSLSFFIIVMLLFLLFFQNKVSLPPFLQSVGRMHPLLLHLPIGLIILSFILWIFRNNIETDSFQKIFILILSVTAFTATLTALMGFFLSKEGGYDAAIISKHKFLGVTTAVLSYTLLLLYQQVPQKKILFGTVVVMTLTAVVLGSDFGSNLTHGEGFVWQPIKGEEKIKEQIITDSSTLFAAVIRPVLESKCFTCHNEKKAKGGLVMTTDEKLLKGGKNGPIWKSGDALNSHIIQNINLPEEEKKHMPPNGKPQLTPEEKQLLFTWIQSGADIKKIIKDYQDTDSLKILATKFIRMPKEEVAEKQYPFMAASTSLIQKLSDPFCSVFPLSQNSPALQADFFVREKFDRKKLEELLKVKEQLVALNLNNMPVTDPDMKFISQFGSLEKLNLNNSAISNKGLEELKKLKKLRSLSVAGTKIDKNAAPIFAQLDSLKEIFIWNSAISAADAKELQQQYKKIVFNYGYVPDEKEILTLTPPALKNESFVLSKDEKVELKHQIQGVAIHYSTDGSIPDSITSPIYKEPIAVNGFMNIKARAERAGWYSSPVISLSFFKKGFKPSGVELINKPDEKYKGDGGTTLIDGKKGVAENFSDGTWLGFREKPFEAEFYFDTAQNINSISFSYGVGVRAFIMPPTEIDVWAGEEKTKLKLVKKIIPLQVTKDQLDVVRAEGIKIDMPPSRYKYYKVVAKNITKLPSWHPGKGQKGWVFVDEFFFN